MAETRVEAIEKWARAVLVAADCAEDLVARAELTDALALPREESAEGWIVREASRRPGMSWVYPLDQKREALRHLGALNCIRRTSELVRVRITAAPEGDAP